MHNTIRILILEDDATDRRKFENYIQSIQDVSIIACTANAEDALRIATLENPDAIIIDLELHNGSGNGLMFLSDLSKHPFPNTPFLLVTTNNSSQTTHDAARSLGADFILTKYEPDYSAEYVINFTKMMLTTMHKSSKPVATPAQKPVASHSNTSELRQNTNTYRGILESDIMCFIREQLLLVGVNPKAVGFNYIADAVLIKLKNPNENFYTILGPKYKKSDPSIERAMQYAINRAWRSGDPDELITHYSARVNSERGVPTIMEFVFYYVSCVQNHFGIK